MGLLFHHYMSYLRMFLNKLVVVVTILAMMLLQESQPRPQYWPSYGGDTVYLHGMYPINPPPQHYPILGPSWNGMYYGGYEAGGQDYAGTQETDALLGAI